MFDTTANNRSSLTMALAFVLVVAAGLFANPLSAQPPPGSTVCFECVEGCASGSGGRQCALAKPGRLGGIICTMDGGPLPGSTICHCYATGGICEGSDQGNSLLAEREALDAVMRDNVLPADGLFYVATRGNNLIVRRKCGGKAIGRIVVAGDGTRSVAPAVA